MPIPALIWGVWSGHTIWFPVNLLAGVVVPGLSNLPPDKLVLQLEAFHPWLLVGAGIMHVLMSIGFGLVGGVLLPTLPAIPGGPLLFGGLILPLLWSGANHSLMGLVNPVLNHYIQWPWYVVSQLVYGITTSIVIMRSEEIPIAPRGPGGDVGGPSIPSGWLGCLAAMSILFSGCNDSLPGKPNPADAYRMPQDITKFHVLYAQRCAGCHGADGTEGPGPPLNNAIYLSLVTNDELHKVIADGRSGTLMPAWSQKSGGPLTDGQVAALVEGIRATWQEAGTSEAAQKCAAPDIAQHRGKCHRRRQGVGNGLCRLPWTQRRGGRHWRRDPRSRVSGPFERPGVAALHHHRPRRSFRAHAQLRRYRRPRRKLQAAYGRAGD